MIKTDFNLPERFDMTYTGDDGAEHRPIMIHRALMGSLERFIGVLIEHYAGAFPLWLAPEQARVMNITDAQADYCGEVYARLRALGVRIEKDVRNEKLNYKIREAQLMKVPYMLIVGDREKEDGTVTVRKKYGQNLPAMRQGATLSSARIRASPRPSSRVRNAAAAAVNLSDWRATVAASA